MIKKEKTFEKVIKQFGSYLFIASLDKDKFKTAINSDPETLLNMFISLFKNVPASGPIASLALKHVESLKVIEKSKDNGGDSESNQPESTSLEGKKE